MRYTLGARKTAVTGSKWLTAMVVLGILAMCLLAYDYFQFGELMNYVLWGVK